MPNPDPSGRLSAVTTGGSSSVFAAFFSALIVSSFASSARAQERPTANATAVAISAQTFAERFEKTSPLVAEIESRVERREADVTRASMLPNPTLSIGREEVFPDGGGLAENSATLGWSLDFSGRRSRKTRSARAEVRAQRARGSRDKLGALGDALTVYYDAALARSRLEAFTEGREPLARMVLALKARVKEGDAAGYDLSRLELELAAYDEQLTAAQVALVAARRRLGGLLGEPDVLYEASDDLTVGKQVTAAKSEVAGALASRGDLAATVLEQTAANAALSAASRGWVPRLGIDVGLKTAELGTETATGYTAMLSVELPLFSRGQADAQSARAARRQASARRKLLEQQIPVQVQIAADRLAAQQKATEVFRTAQLERSLGLVAKAESIYQSGEGSVVELLDAYRASSAARLRYLTLLRQAKAAQLELSYVLGQRPEFVAP